MPLTLEQLEEIQAENFADDVAIDFDKMSLWTEAEARHFFESFQALWDGVKVAHREKSGGAAAVRRL